MPTCVSACVHPAGVVNSRALVGYPDRSLSVPATRASKLRVAPGFLEPLRRIPGVFGQYWVVAFEPTNYDWAIVSPGPPEIKSNGACRTGDPALRRFQRLGTGENAHLPARALLGGARRGVLSAMPAEDCDGLPRQCCPAACTTARAWRSPAVSAGGVATSSCLVVPHACTPPRVSVCAQGCGCSPGRLWTPPAPR